MFTADQHTTASQFKAIARHIWNNARCETLTIWEDGQSKQVKIRSFDRLETDAEGIWLVRSGGRRNRVIESDSYLDGNFAA